MAFGVLVFGFLVLVCVGLLFLPFLGVGGSFLAVCFRPLVLGFDLLFVVFGFFVFWPLAFSLWFRVFRQWVVGRWSLGPGPGAPAPAQAPGPGPLPRTRSPGPGRRDPGRGVAVLSSTQNCKAQVLVQNSNLFLHKGFDQDFKTNLRKDRASFQDNLH